MANVNYLVTVHTGTLPGAGTDANVFVSIKGDKGAIPPQNLDKRLYDDFEPGAEDTYRIPWGYEIGELESITIEHDNTGEKPAWYLEKITVKIEDEPKEWDFTAKRWIGQDDGDGELSVTLTPDVCSYEVMVATGTEDGAETEAEVYVGLYGSKNSVPVVRLTNNNPADFEAGTFTKFQLEVFPDLGELDHINIWHDNTGKGPGWYVNYVRVTKKTPDEKEWIFQANRWLARDEADGKTIATLYPER